MVDLLSIDGDLVLEKLMGIRQDHIGERLYGLKRMVESISKRLGGVEVKNLRFVLQACSPSKNLR